MQKHETEPEKKRWQMSNKNAETVQIKQGDGKKKELIVTKTKVKKKKNTNRLSPILFKNSTALLAALTERDPDLLRQSGVEITPVVLCVL